MSKLDLSRLQFALTTLVHFLFVPLTIGLAWMTAIMQTAWRRTGNPEWLRITRFFGKLLLINVAIGVATGLVQQFQFGMNWSSYSRFVGDVFGAPLAIEGLAAFFLESTFLGIWIFGWNRLSPRLHLATIYAAAIGATLSALFILAANSWMQNPVGYEIDKATGAARLTDIGALFTNKIFLWAFPHTVLAAFVLASAVVLAVSAWHLRRGSNVEGFRRSAALALLVMFPASGLALMTGGRLAINITDVQPMKTASMEALWNSEGPASFSLFQIGGFSASDPDPVIDLEIPHLLSLLATGTWNGEVEGINQAQASSEEEFGEGNYIPYVRLAYWSLRIMAYGGVLMLLLSGVGLWLLHRRRLASSRGFLAVGLWSLFLPYSMLLAGWVLAETGRQPWVVWELQKTADAVSPSVSRTEVAFTLGAFVVLYAVLVSVNFVLMRRFARRDLEPVPEFEDPDGPGGPGGPGDRTPLDLPALSY